MRSTEDTALDIVTLQTEFERKMKVLTPWQQFLVIMHVYGWTARAIAEHACITPQSVGYQYRKARKALGYD